MSLAHRQAAVTEAEALEANGYISFGELKVRELPALAGEPACRSIERVGIVGGGLMGTGIAIAILNAGIPVTLVEVREEALARAGDAVRKSLSRDVEKGRLTREEADTRLSRLTLATSLEALADMDLIIEAVFEDLAVKREVFTALDRLAAPEAILASNTSALDLDEIAGFVRDPSRVVGLHFFSPANIMRLLEVVRGAATAPDVLATAMRFATRIGKIGVVAGVCDGFIGNRMFEEYLRQVYWLLEEGASPRQIDGAMERWGMAMGPLRVMDLAGHDVGHAIRARRALEQPDRPYSGILDFLQAEGRFGQKSGAGIYRYRDGRTAEHDAAVDARIADYRESLHLRPGIISDDEIVARCLLALVNEGARIVGEGIAYRPVDVDMIYLNGYGFPRSRGGPLFQADAIGAAEIVANLQMRAAGRNGWSWEPAPLLVELAARGGTFADLNS